MIDPAALFPAEASLLGFALRDLVKDLGCRRRSCPAWAPTAALL
jgi:hypothetical protein